MVQIVPRKPQSMLMANIFESIVYKPNPFYQLTPLIWILLTLTVYFSVVVIKYLDSKPPLTQTVMDFANKILFVYFMLQNIHVGIMTTCRQN